MKQRLNITADYASVKTAFKSDKRFLYLACTNIQTNLQRDKKSKNYFLAGNLSTTCVYVLFIFKNCRLCSFTILL